MALKVLDQTLNNQEFKLSNLKIACQIKVINFSETLMKKFKISKNQILESYFKIIKINCLP